MLTESRPDVKSKAQEVIAMAQEKGIQIVDFKFIDLPGTVAALLHPRRGARPTDLFTEGIGFDGSSHPRLPEDQRERHAAAAGPDTAFLDPACKIPTLSLICDVIRPGRWQRYSRDPRYIAKKAEAYLIETGIADDQLLRSRGRVLHLQLHPLRPGRAHSGYYYIDSDEGIWNSGAQRHGQPGLPAALQGGLLPGSADGQAAGPALARSCWR